METFLGNLIRWPKNLYWREKRTGISKVVSNKIWGELLFLLVVILIKAVYYKTRNSQTDQWDMVKSLEAYTNTRHPNICGIWGKGANGDSYNMPCG